VNTVKRRYLSKKGIDTRGFVKERRCYLANTKLHNYKFVKGTDWQGDPTFYFLNQELPQIMIKF